MTLQLLPPIYIETNPLDHMNGKASFRETEDLASFLQQFIMQFQWNGGTFMLRKEDDNSCKHWFIANYVCMFIHLFIRLLTGTSYASPLEPVVGERWKTLKDVAGEKDILNGGGQVDVHVYKPANRHKSMTILISLFPFLRHRDSLSKQEGRVDE